VGLRVDVYEAIPRIGDGLNLRSRNLSKWLCGEAGESKKAVDQGGVVVVDTPGTVEVTTAALAELQAWQQRPSVQPHLAARGYPTTTIHRPYNVTTPSGKCRIH
jgi:hypothetical protein